MEAEKIIGLDATVSGNETVAVGSTAFIVIPTPGHTLGQIALYNPTDGHVFTADALFSMGCGKMLEGKPAAMWEGLKALRALPEHTLMFCGHEYSVANARFALSVDPNNTALRIRAAEVNRMRDEGRYTVPVSMGMEKRTNPFLRSDTPEMAKAMGLDRDVDPSVVFAALRAAKDNFA
jgi:hydroxyacylglutathione hydrolase